MTLDQWLKLHKRYERYAFKVFKQGLKASYGPLLANIQLMDYSNYENMTTYLVSPVPLNEAYVKVYTKIGLTHGKIVGKELSSIRKAYTPEGYESEYMASIYQFIKEQLGSRIVGVNDYTIELIRELVEYCQDQNMTIIQMRAYLVKQLNSDRFNKMRALRIARTETTTAANYGASKAAEKSDLALDKEWISVMDERTRRDDGKGKKKPDHWHMNGVKAKEGEPFKMTDGTLMMFPGDQTAPAGQVINCRCMAAYTGRRDENGMLIFKR